MNQFITRILPSVCIAAALLYSFPALAQELPKEKEEEYAKDSTTEINVKNADIAAIVRIFSKKTKRNYILDENVKGKVSIYLPGKVSSDEAIRILDTVLNLKGFSSVPVGENLWKIVPAKDAKQSTIPTITGDSDIDGSPSAAVVTRLINLKYIKAEDLQQLLAQLISPNGLINAYTGTNSLLLIDAEDNIERLLHIVQSLDVPFSNREMSILPIKYAEAIDIAEKLVEIMGGGSQGKGGTESAGLPGIGGVPGGAVPANVNAGGAPGRPGPAVLTTGSGTVTGRGLEPKIIPDERTNSIIVVADEDMTARIKALVSELDSEIDFSGNQFFVYRCQHANAEDLAEVLSGLVGGGGGTGGSRGGTGRTGGLGGFGGFGTGDSDGGIDRGFRRDSGGLRTDRSASGFDNRFQQSSSVRARSGSRGSGGTGGAGSGTVSANLGEDLSVTADPATNSLVIHGSKADYERVKLLLEKLDIKRRQVLVEAMLLEVALDDSVTTGAEWIASGGGEDGGVFASSNFGNLSTLFSDPTKLQGFSMAAASAGTLSLPGGLSIPSQTILLTAAKSNRNVNVLSAPTILATDNEEAEIVVGQNVPFLASVSTSETNLNNTFNQVEREDVGIKLRITPQISSRDFVTLNMFTEVSNILSVSSTLGPTTTIRTSQTTVIAKNGQMIVIGGLMADDNQQTDEGVPYLSDVPVLGHLFKLGTDSVRRTNLLIFITPRILKDQFDAREATVVKRDRMEDVISEQETYPAREEVLRNDDIDSVSESVVWEGAKPGTIRPSKRIGSDRADTAPKKAVILKDEALNLEMQNAEQPSADEDVLELEASPSVPREKLPETVAQKNAPVIEPENVRAALIAPRDDVPSSAYVVMALDPKTAVPSNIPFSINTDTLTFGVAVPESSTPTAREFFQVGKSYRYAVGGDEVRLTPVGVFRSENEARAIHPEINGGWYILSPYEIMNLGRGPWMRMVPK